MRSLIAWLSVCVLVAAWGPQLDTSVKELWALVGSFGLASALAFDIFGQVHRHVTQHFQRQKVERQFERSLTRLLAQNEPSPAIRPPLQRVAEHNRLLDASSRERPPE